MELVRQVSGDVFRRNLVIMHPETVRVIGEIIDKKPA